MELEEGLDLPPSNAAGEVHASKWPLWTAAAATLLLLGVLVPVLGLLGLLLLAVSLTGWIREDLPSHFQGTEFARRSDRWYGVLFLLMGEVVLFGTLFTYYFWARSYSASWPPPEIPAFDLSLVSINTAVLLTSGWTAHKAHAFLARGEPARFRRWLGATLALGAAFLGGQVYEYATAGFLPSSNTSGTAFFALTGVHGFHVLAGLLVLGLFLARSRGGRLTKQQTSGIGGGVLYWHFVDAVWVALYGIVYLRLV